MSKNQPDKPGSTPGVAMEKAILDAISANPDLMDGFPPSVQAAIRAGDYQIAEPEGAADLPAARRNSGEGRLEVGGTVFETQGWRNHQHLLATATIPLPEGTLVDPVKGPPAEAIAMVDSLTEVWRRTGIEGTDTADIVVGTGPDVPEAEVSVAICLDDGGGDWDCAYAHLEARRSRQSSQDAPLVVSSDATLDGIGFRENRWQGHVHLVAYSGIVPFLESIVWAQGCYDKTRLTYPGREVSVGHAPYPDGEATIAVICLQDDLKCARHQVRRWMNQVKPSDSDFERHFPLPLDLIAYEGCSHLAGRFDYPPGEITAERVEHAVKAAFNPPEGQMGAYFVAAEDVGLWEGMLQEVGGVARIVVCERPVDDGMCVVRHSVSLVCPDADQEEQERLVDSLTRHMG